MEDEWNRRLDSQDDDVERLSEEVRQLSEKVDALTDALLETPAGAQKPFIQEMREMRRSWDNLSAAGRLGMYALVTLGTIIVSFGTVVEWVKSLLSGGG